MARSVDSHSSADGRAKVPPRKQVAASRNRPRRPSKHRPGSRRWAYAGGGALVIAIAAVVVIFAVTSGSGTKDRAVNFTLADKTKVYGGVGYERVPLELGDQLAPSNLATGSPVDGIQCNAGEHTEYHHHVHLAIFVHGKPYSVPLGVGMVPPANVINTAHGPAATGSSTCLYWLHVHATDGIIHIESPEPKIFELGQFFDLWGTNLSPNQLGTFSGNVSATINGKPFSGDPRTISLDAHSQIVLNLGTPEVSPPPINWKATQL